MGAGLACGDLIRAVDGCVLGASARLRQGAAHSAVTQSGAPGVVASTSSARRKEHFVWSGLCLSCQHTGGLCDAPAPQRAVPTSLAVRSFTGARPGEAICARIVEWVDIVFDTISSKVAC